MHHVLPFVFGHKAFIELVDNLFLVFFHILADKDQILSSVSNLCVLKLRLRVLGEFFCALPWSSGTNTHLNSSLAHLEEDVGSIGQPQESLGPEEMREGSLALFSVDIFPLLLELRLGLLEAHLILLLSLIILVFDLFSLFHFLVFVIVLLLIIVGVDDLHDEVGLEQLVESLGVEWLFGFVLEAGDAVLIIAVFDFTVRVEPLAHGFCLLEIKHAGVDDLGEVHLGLHGLHD